MRLLLIGGTVFLGRHLVYAGLERGHEITLFNRGRHNPELFPEVEKIRGDRDGGLDALAGREWDAALDTCGYVPRLVRASAERLAGRVGHYTFISSLSVYADNSIVGEDESGRVGTLADQTIEEITGESYGPLKALCEQAAEAAMPGRVLNVRSGLIVGPDDPTDRFTYWPVRVGRGGDVLAPDDPHYAVQFIDVRDLAEWIIGMAEAGKAGVYNATGPAERLSLGEVLEASQRLTGSDARFIWAPAAFLLEKGVEPWSEIPLWVPGAEYAGFHTTNINKALADGLRFRSLSDTIQATLDYANGRPADHTWRAGLPAEREAALLAELPGWQSARPAG
jgi:2'-hydroxyisoflavone reductase